MYTDEFEDAFADFLDRHEYDEAENYLFSMVRLAFAAGDRLSIVQETSRGALAKKRGVTGWYRGRLRWD